MRALVLERFGSVDDVSPADVAEPRAGPGEVVVALRAASLNHLDLWSVTGSLGIDLPFPYILGADGAGEVVEVGAAVTGVNPGTRVIVNPAVACRVCEWCRAGEQSQCVDFKMLGEHLPGTFAERVVAPASNVFAFPDHLSFGEAAALGVTFITAYRMLFSRGRLRAGESVLVTGIGGGLALSLFQLARPVAGKLFVTSSSNEKLELAAALGADATINYVEEDVGRATRRLTGKRGVDVVVDSAGGPTLDASLRSLRKGGRLVLAGATAGRKGEIDTRRLFWNQLELIGSTMGSDADVAAMLRAVEGQRLRPIVDRTFPLADGRAALRYLADQDQFGKVVLEIA